MEIIKKIFRGIFVCAGVLFTLLFLVPFFTWLADPPLREYSVTELGPSPSAMVKWPESYWQTREFRDKFNKVRRYEIKTKHDMLEFETIHDIAGTMGPGIWIVCPTESPPIRLRLEVGTFEEAEPRLSATDVAFMTDEDGSVLYVSGETDVVFQITATERPTAVKELTVKGRGEWQLDVDGIYKKYEITIENPGVIQKVLDGIKADSRALAFLGKAGDDPGMTASPIGVVSLNGFKSALAWFEQHCPHYP